MISNHYFLLIIIYYLLLIKSLLFLFLVKKILVINQLIAKYIIYICQYNNYQLYNINIEVMISFRLDRKLQSVSYKFSEINHFEIRGCHIDL